MLILYLPPYLSHISKTTGIKLSASLFSITTAFLHLLHFITSLTHSLYPSFVFLSFSPPLLPYLPPSSITHLLSPSFLHLSLTHSAPPSFTSLSLTPPLLPSPLSHSLLPSFLHFSLVPSSPPSLPSYTSSSSHSLSHPPLPSTHLQYLHQHYLVTGWVGSHKPGMGHCLRESLHAISCTRVGVVCGCAVPNSEEYIQIMDTASFTEDGLCPPTP